MLRSRYVKGEDEEDWPTMVILQTLGYTSWAPFLSTQSHKELSGIMIKAVESASLKVGKSLKIGKKSKKN